MIKYIVLLIFVACIASAKNNEETKESAKDTCEKFISSSSTTTLNTTSTPTYYIKQYSFRTQLKSYIDNTWDDFKIEAARGNGEILDGFVSLFLCDEISSIAIKKQLKENYELIFKDLEKYQSNILIGRIQEKIRYKSTISLKCKKL